MEYAEYLRQISFRLLQPGTPRPAGFRALSQLARKAGIHLEMWMTTLPDDQQGMQLRLKNLCRLRRKSTFAIGAIINRGVARMPADQAFLCLGVGRGFEFFSGMAGNHDRRCIGVDNFERRPRSRRAFLERFNARRSALHDFHESGIANYLMRVHQGQVGYCVCDLATAYRPQLETLRLLEPNLAEGAIVLLNNGNTPEVRRAAVDFQAAALCEYSLLLDARTPRSGHPTFWNGVLLLERGRPKAESGAVAPTERRAA
jgi:Methyltransferase domain